MRNHRYIDIQGTGFAKLMDFEGWRIARNGYKEGVNDYLSVRSLGRHHLTKEVFVLLQGEAVMITGGSGETIGKLKYDRLVENQAYVVHENTWHFLALSPGGLTFVVENSNTSTENSVVSDLTDEQIDEVRTVLTKDHRGLRNNE